MAEKNISNAARNNMNFENKINNQEQRFEQINGKMLSVLDSFDKTFGKEGVKNWVVGGWAVEGLKGGLSRNHHDIDYLVQEADKEKIKKVLSDNGFDIENGWMDNDQNFHEFKHKIIAKKDDISIDFVFVCLDDDKKAANIKSYDKFKFPAEYLSGKKAVVNFDGNAYNFNIPDPELLLIAKHGDDRSDDQEAKYLTDVIGHDKAKDAIEKYGFSYADFRKDTM